MRRERLQLLRLGVAAVIAASAAAVAAAEADAITTVAAAAMVVDPECPVQLLTVSTLARPEDDLFVLSETGINYLEKQRSPLYFVPLLGVYRGGKSLLLNRCMGLQAPYARGFGVGHEQDTHTRGIDICAEFVENLGGTVVWMDTEGLFSSEFARGQYGKKMFSMSLLFSSLVMLNSLTVLNEQFFSFFGEQLQVARVLRQGLVAEGFPESGMLPRNMSIIWVMQRPISDTVDTEQLAAQLGKFLNAGNDEARQHVRREFSHRLHVIPKATNDVRLWNRLDGVGDKELEPAYISSVVSLRSQVLDLLKSARSMEAAGVRGALRMYADLVQSEKFSGKLTREAFETSELAARCGNFTRRVREILGEALPSRGLVRAMVSARSEVDHDARQAAENFHFGEAWQKRVHACVDTSVADFENETDRLLLALWEKEARTMSEGDACFFLSDLMTLRNNIWEDYGVELRSSVRAASVKLATSLQRARLVGCLRVKHFLWPLAPGLAWPVISLYLRPDCGFFSSFLQLVMHVVIVAGAYLMAGSFRMLPPYLDLDYPVLQARPMLLDATMQVIPWMPWTTLANFLGAAGLCYTMLKVTQALARRLKPSGDAVGGMVVLEQKVNILMDRSRLTLEQQLLECLQDAYCLSTRGDEHSTALALLRVLVFIRGIGGDDAKLNAMADAPLRRRAEKLLASSSDRQSWILCKAWLESDALHMAFQGKWFIALDRVVRVLETASSGRREAPSSPEEQPVVGRAGGAAAATEPPVARRAGLSSLLRRSSGSGSTA